VSAGVPAHPFLDHPGPLPFAHRGGAEEHPENTMAAFDAAIRLGYRYLETDVHVTADGVLLAFHDDRLDRVTDRGGVIAQLPWSEVGRARVAGTEPIVRFDELLRMFPSARLNVDPKHPAAVLPLVRTIRAAGAMDRVCVGAFSDGALAIVRAELGTDGCTSLGPNEVARLRLGSWPGGSGLLAGLRPASGSGARCVQIPLRGRGLRLVEPRLIAAAHALGFPVHAWTINDPTEMERLLELGVDGLMTDRPTVLRRVLEARGQWHPAPGGAPAMAPPGPRQPGASA
jgi:glycerophosphoryl diester phosphodiesterase